LSRIPSGMPDFLTPGRGKGEENVSGGRNIEHRTPNVQSRTSNAPASR
jgi:hypothetical protein